MPAMHGVAASPWRPPHAARALRWWDERGLVRMAEVLQGLFTQWAADWSIPCAAAQVCCRVAGCRSIVGEGWLSCEAGEVAQAWLLMPRQGACALPAVLFPGAVSLGPLAHAVAASCRQDAWTRIAALLGLACGAENCEPPPGALARVGSGAVEAVLPASLGIRLLVAPELAARWCSGASTLAARARQPLVAATTALASHAMALQVELGGCELEVGALQGLQVGDIVRLDHALDRPASVRNAGSPLCGAYLGRRGNRKAVELAGRLLPAAGESTQ